jgi:hypothetical protein
MTKRNKQRKEAALLEQPYEWFDLLYPERRKDRQKIEQLLIGKASLNTVPHAILDYILSPEVGKSAPKCRSVVVEWRYLDKDHARALSTFYSKAFRDVKKECVRLHFFRSRLSEADLANLEQQGDSYLGFSVIRPFPYRRIGRTVLAKPRNQRSLEFATCHGDFEVNIGGSSLSVKGCPFMEQDTMVAACASAALWMSIATLASRFGLLECASSEITERAAQYLIQNRPMPSEGLLCEQMLHALRTMNYDPLLLGIESQEQAKHVIYSHVESEIPPILLCSLATGGDHTIVAVGHRYQLPVEKPRLTSIAWPNEPPLSFARSSEWVPYFLVNDDQRGPYRKLSFIQPDATSLKERIKKTYPSADISDLHYEEWRCPVALDMNMPLVNISGEEIANIWGIIVPLPQGVPLTSEQAEKKAARLIRLWHDQAQIPLPDDLVLRTYLVPSNEYKQRIEDGKMYTFVKRLLRGKPMPRWIWVTEISTINSYNSPAPPRWLINGTIIIDATSSAWTPDFVAFHYIREDIGIVATMKPEHDDPEQALQQVWFGRDKPYPAWVR